MFRSHLLIVATVTITFAAAAAAFHNSSGSTSSTANATTGSLVPVAPMLAPRSGHTATLLPDGKVLTAGGMRRNQDFYKSAEIYDPATNQFQPTGEMSVGRVGHLAILLRSGKVLIAGGVDSSRHHRLSGTLRPGHRQIQRNLKDDHAPCAGERHLAG